MWLFTWSTISTAATSNPRNNQPTGAKYEPWGVAGDPEKLWTVAELKTLRREIEDAGLVLAAIENLDPAHWHDILLDGPQRPQQIEKVKTIIRRMGEAGIPVLGYNFSLAGVCGRVTAPLGRGHAVTLGMDGPAEDVPIPNGMIWNMVYDPAAPAGTLPSISHEELWRRLERLSGRCQSRSPKNRACVWPHIRTILPCQPCAGSLGWFTSRTCIND